MFLEILIWQGIGAIARSHNKKQQEEFRRKFPKTNYESIPRMKPIENKPFSFYLDQAMEKIK